MSIYYQQDLTETQPTMIGSGLDCDAELSGMFSNLEDIAVLPDDEAGAVMETMEDIVDLYIEDADSTEMKELDDLFSASATPVICVRDPRSLRSAAAASTRAEIYFSPSPPMSPAAPERSTSCREQARGRSVMSASARGNIASEMFSETVMLMGSLPVIMNTDKGQAILNTEIIKGSIESFNLKNLFAAIRVDGIYSSRAYSPETYFLCIQYISCEGGKYFEDHEGTLPQSQLERIERGETGKGGLYLTAYLPGHKNNRIQVCKDGKLIFFGCPEEKVSVVTQCVIGLLRAHGSPHLRLAPGSDFNDHTQVKSDTNRKTIKIGYRVKPEQLKRVAEEKCFEDGGKCSATIHEKKSGRVKNGGGADRRGAEFVTLRFPLATRPREKKKKCTVKMYPTKGTCVLYASEALLARFEAFIEQFFREKRGRLEDRGDLMMEIDALAEF